MTFKTIAVKNFKCQLRKYMAYFLCSSFSIMIFFMYSTLLFNDEINAFDGFDLLFKTGIVTVTLFSVFFVNYAHSVFIKTRHKEFAVYMTLGMNQKDIGRIVLIENLLIIVSSLLAGLVSGLLFSRLFQMIALKLLGIEGVGYSVSYECFTLTIAVFTAIFLCVIAISRLSTRKLDISQLFSKARKSDHKSRYSLVLGSIGILAIIASCFVLYYAYHHQDSDWLPLISFLLILPGMYLAISNLGNAILRFYKRNRRLYYKNLLITTELSYKFNQNRKILFVLSILSFVIILFTGMTFSMYSMSKSMARILQPNDLEYVQIGKINAVGTETIQQILKDAGTPVTSQKSLEFVSLTIQGDTDQNDLLGSKPAVSQKTYNDVTYANLNVPKGQVVSVIIPGSPVMSPYKPPVGKIVFQLRESTFEADAKNASNSEWISGLSLYPASAGLIMNDEDYAYIKSKLQHENIGAYHSFNFKDWGKTKNAAEKLRTTLEAYNNLSSEKIDGKLFGVSSRIEFYESFKHNYAIGIFILSIISILFFIAAGSVLYFKQFSEIAGMKEKFYKLYKIGITDKEIVSIISKELKLIFFVPMAFGIIPGYAFIGYSCSMLGGARIIMELMAVATVVVAAYFLFQAIFYLTIKKKYVNEVLEGI